MTFIQDVYKRSAELNTLIQQLGPLLQPPPSQNGCPPTMGPASGVIPPPSMSYLPRNPPSFTHCGASESVHQDPYSHRSHDLPPQPVTVVGSQHSVATNSSGVTEPSPSSCQGSPSDLVVTYDDPHDVDRQEIRDFEYPTTVPVHNSSSSLTLESTDR